VKRTLLLVMAIAHAAGGQPNFYPDIIGGRPISVWDDGKRRYLTRNAMLGAVSPSMSFGNAPWAMQRADYEAAVLKAAQWHEKYLPDIHSAALDAHETGYPSTATPLPIAYPDDPATYELGNRSNKQYELMLGPSLLVHPLFGSDYVTATTRDVYLPEGKWVDLEDGTVHHGPTTLTGQPVGIDEVPAFVGGKGVLVSGDTSGLRAEVFPIATGGSTYTHRTATLTSTIRNDNTGWDLSALQVLDTTTDRPVAFDTDPVTGAIDFALQPGHDYRLVGGGNAPHPFEVETEAPGVPQGLAVTTVDQLATLSWQPVDGARSYTVLRVADDGSTSVAGSTSTTSLALGFATETEGWFAVRASSSAGTSCTSERIAVGDPAPGRVDQAFTDDFAAPTGAWQPVSGTWQVRDGRFEVVLIKPDPATPDAVVTLGSAASGLDPVAAPVRLRVEVVGDRVRVFAGDGPDPLVDVQDTTYRDGGVALLSTYSEASFDGVAVRLP